MVDPNTGSETSFDSPDKGENNNINNQELSSSNGKPMEQAGRVGEENKTGIKPSSIKESRLTPSVEEQVLSIHKTHEEASVSQKMPSSPETSISDVEVTSILEKEIERVRSSRDDELTKNLAALNDSRNDARTAMAESVKNTAEATERMRKAREALANRKRQ